MIDKKSLLNNFAEDEKSEVINLYEKMNMSMQRDIPLFGNNFYTPNVWRFFESHFNSKDFKVASLGFFEDAERRMISFNNIYEMDYPFEILKIEAGSKFQKLSHRDFLGALLGLGIKRNKIGDLLVIDDDCYVAVCEEISDFIISNLSSVGRVSCKIGYIDENIDILKPKFEESIILVPSLRIDSIVAKLSNTSRSKIQNVVENGKVLIDYCPVKSKSEEVKKDQRITIRGKGKFIIGDIVGNSKSGKYKLKIKKYT